MFAAKPGYLWKERNESHKISSVAWVSTHNKQTNRRKRIRACVHACTHPKANMLHADTDVYSVYKGCV